MAAVEQLDAEQLQRFLAQAEQMMAEAPEENRDLAEALFAIIGARIKTMGDGR